jgi:hypothetical protein
MSVDLRAIERRLKPEKRAAQLQRRSDDALPFANADLVPIGTRVLLDTCVYIDAAADRLPDAIAALLPRRFHHRSSVCLAELTAAFGELDPTDRRTPRNRATIEEITARIGDDERMVVPDDHEWAMAGMLAGMLAQLAQNRDAF